MSICLNCSRPMFGSTEIERGVCSGCVRPISRRPLVKALSYVCQQCGREERQSVMGRPRVYCPSCSTATARRHRAKAR